MKAKSLNRRVKHIEADKQYELDIDAVNKSYHYHKHVLFEDENGLANYDYHKLMYSKRSVSKVERSLAMLPERAKLIIDAEVIDTKKGTKWYREFFSVPSYYRNRKTAYKLFIDLVNK